MMLVKLTHKSIKSSIKYKSILEIIFNDGFIQVNKFYKLHKGINNIILIKYTFGNYHFLNCKLHNLNMFAVYDEKDCDNPELCMPIMVNFYAINGECMNYNSWKNNKLVINNKRTLKIKNLTKD